MKSRITVTTTLSLCAALLASSPEAAALSLPGIADACWDLHVGNSDIPQLPAGFFGPGSEPFFSIPQGIGLTPTDPALPPFCDQGQPHPPIQLFAPDPTLPDPSAVQIEMVQLDLVSIQPIQVVFNDGTERFYDVFINLDGLPPQPSSQPFPPGQFIVDSFFDIAYQIDFVDIDSGLPAPGGPLLGELPMISPPMPWFHDPVADLLVPGFDGFDLEPFEFVSPAAGMRLSGVADFPDPIDGDLNRDGFVGIDDLNIVLANWNFTVPPADSRADPSGDGFVGIDDLNVVLGNWNSSAPPAASAVPEPASLAMLATGALYVTRRKRR